MIPACLPVMAVSLCVVFILVASVHSSDGNLTFASYYQDHMVLQKSPERAVLWGYGPEGAEVTLHLSGPMNQESSVVYVTKVQVLSGIWYATLVPVEAGGPYTVTASSENGTATLTDVLFGDVWLCGGQSNMCFETYKLFKAAEEMARAPNYPHVRTFMVAMEKSQTEMTDLIKVALPWSVPSATNVAGFSAVCWLFGRYMNEHLKYPIGLVESCWGGTPVEDWSSPRVLQQCGIGQNSPQGNSVLWNSMIHPLLKMTIKGAIWYQGEANANHNQEKYNCTFPAMIDDWRMAFHNGSGGQTANDFPFGFVQLSTSGSTSYGIPNIRWHQTADYGFVPNPRMQKTFMAVALDLPDANSPYGKIHPRDKEDVASRLTLGAKAVVYNETDVAFQGPFPKKIMSTSMYLNITYDQTVSVTVSMNIFEIYCSEIQTLFGLTSLWVSAPIVQWDSTTVRVSTIFCPLPYKVAALRYAWKDWPCDFKACPIYSTSGILPAPPFIVYHYQGDFWECQ